MGTWIEILAELMYQIELAVVPHVGTWIEIQMISTPAAVDQSFPTWERGLKLLRTQILS